jgi:Leucine-rich repeat (LRR) protein
MSQSSFNHNSGFHSDERNRQYSRGPRIPNSFDGQGQNKNANQSQYNNNGHQQGNHGQGAYFDPSLFALNGRVEPYEQNEYERGREQTPQNNTYYRPDDFGSNGQPPKKNMTAIIVILILSFLLLVGATFLTVLLLNRKDSETEDPEEPTPTETPFIPVETSPHDPEEHGIDEIVTETASHDSHETVTETPIETPTETPLTPTPTPLPTPTPTPLPTPTPVPKTFTFGGATVQTGATEICGRPDDLNFNGDGKGYFTRISREEVETMVALCPDLRVLDVDYCFFETYEPLAKLKNLEYLELKTCGNSKGGVPLTDIGWIEGLTNLTHLNLCHNKIHDISALENLNQLEWLNLGDNGLDDSDLSYLEDLTALNTLYLYSNNLKDVSALKNLSALETLNLGNNKNIKTVKSLTKLKKLSTLQVFGTSIDDLSYFKDFAKLTKVDLAGCKKLVYSDYYYDLKNCKKLKTFVVAKDDYDGISAGEKLKSEGSSIKYEIKK